MRQEMAKLLMDVAKYVITAVILSSMFGDMSTMLTIIMAIVIILACLSISYILLKDTNKKGK